ncbi:MAG TPA: hypothetical protein VFY08_02885 [Actinomycetota bacterium]|nr:hypothetical protein [Actinomycetota bacterium]
MGWLLLVALVVLWAAFLVPSWASSPNKADKSMKDFERNMDLLAETESPGRWIVTPRKGTTFIGLRARAQARARERRRRVLIVLIESLVLTALIGLVPPLRAMWYATATLLVLLAGYVWALLTMKAQADAHHPARPRETAATAPASPRPTRQRYAADASNRTARRSFNGLPAFGDDLVNIVVRPAAEVDAARI